MTPEESKEILFTMTAIWPQKISDPTLMVWNELLATEDSSRVQEAVKRLAKTNKFWPSWSEIQEIVDMLKRDAREAPKALETGHKVLSQEESLIKVREIKENRRIVNQKCYNH